MWKAKEFIPGRKYRCVYIFITHILIHITYINKIAMMCSPNYRQSDLVKQSVLCDGLPHHYTACRGGSHLLLRIMATYRPLAKPKTLRKWAKRSSSGISQTDVSKLSTTGRNSKALTIGYKGQILLPNTGNGGNKKTAHAAQQLMKFLVHNVKELG